MSTSFDNLIGKKILQLNISTSKEFLEFVTDSGVFYFETYGDCCSHTWIEHLNGTAFILDEVVTGAIDVDFDEIEQEESSCIKNYITALYTAKGTLDIEYRNESNGYYGGSMDALDETDMKAFDRNSYNFIRATDF